MQAMCFEGGLRNLKGHSLIFASKTSGQSSCLVVITEIQRLEYPHNHRHHHCYHYHHGHRSLSHRHHSCSCLAVQHIFWTHLKAKLCKIYIAYCTILECRMFHLKKYQSYILHIYICIPWMKNSFKWRMRLEIYNQNWASLFAQNRIK